MGRMGKCRLVVKRFSELTDRYEKNYSECSTEIAKINKYQKG